MKRLIGQLAALLTLLAMVPSQSAQAADKKVLFITFTGNYNAPGVAAFDEVVNVVGAGQATHLLLNTEGLVAPILAADTYEQIWVYDLSHHADAYDADFAAIADWYDDVPSREIICDGRFLGSFKDSRNTGEGRVLTQNYYHNFDVRGGGLLLATDHDIFAVNGANDIASLIGINGFTGNFGGSFPLDAGHPLTTTPNVIASLFNDTSTGQAPFGLQPNGRTLHTIGYHSGNSLTPGLSTTIGGGSLSFTVEITGSGGTICDGTVELSAAITEGDDLGPFTYSWYAGDVEIGQGPTLSHPVANMASGEYVFRAVAVGAGGRADDDVVTVFTGDDYCGCGAGAGPLCDDGGAAFVIPVEGPVSNQFAICRMIPAGQGDPVAAVDEFRCDDDNQDGVVDLFSGDDITNYFGAGFCGAL